jgi:hypothetical protein
VSSSAPRCFTDFPTTALRREKQVCTARCDKSGPDRSRDHVTRIPTRTRTARDFAEASKFISQSACRPLRWNTPVAWLRLMHSAISGYGRTIDNCSARSLATALWSAHFASGLATSSYTTHWGTTRKSPDQRSLTNINDGYPLPCRPATALQ